VKVHGMPKAKDEKKIEENKKINTKKYILTMIYK
jgi:hypothetical protein